MNVSAHELSEARTDPRNGAVRLSFVHYNSAEEMDRVIAALDRELGA